MSEHPVGTYVVLQDHANNNWIKKIEPFGIAKISKMKVPWDLIASTPYGGTIRNEKGDWQRCKRMKLGIIEGQDEVPDTVGTDNRNLIDDNTAQSLSSTEIKELRSSALSNAEIIDMIAKNSATFANKTKFAQEKYIKKKQEKHLQQLTILEATPNLITKVISSISAGRSCGLRHDTLGAMVSYANLRPGHRTAILDHSHGILFGAALKIVGAHPNGRVFALLTNDLRDKTSKQFNLGPEIESRMVYFPKSIAFREDFPKNFRNLTADPESRFADEFLQGLEYDHIHFPSKPDPNDHVARVRKTATLEDGEEEMDGENKSESEEDAGDVSKKQKVIVTTTDDATVEVSPKQVVTFEERMVKYYERRDEKLREIDSLSSQGLDSLLGCLGTLKLEQGESLFKTTEDLANFAIRMVKPDGRFVITASQMEPLSKLAARLQASRSFIAIKLEEFMFREHQVLPNRTHPTMKSDNRTFEGFVLSAIKVRPVGGDGYQF